MMNLIFRTNVDANPFSMKVAYSDSVLRIKEKIQHHRGIPAPRQTLVFNGAILSDDFIAADSRIVDGSTIHVFVDQSVEDHQFLDNIYLDYSLLNDLLQSPTHFNRSLIQSPTTILPQYPFHSSGYQLLHRHQSDNSSVIRQSPTETNASPSSNTTDDQSQNPIAVQSLQRPNRRGPSLKIWLRLKLPDSREMSVELDGRCRVRRLKEKISEAEGIPISRITIRADGNVLCSDHVTLYSCKLSSVSDVRVSYKPPPVVTREETSSSTMRVVVEYEGRRCTVAVRGEEQVSVLRGRLWQMDFRVPEVYFFTHDQRVVEEDRSFIWNTVAHGDAIEIFPGYVTCGDEP